MDECTSYKALDQLFNLSDSHLCNGNDSIYPVKIVKWVKFDNISKLLRPAGTYADYILFSYYHLTV